VGGDGTVLSAAHFLDHGTIPLLGINSDPVSAEEVSVGGAKKKVDERRSHGALCMCTSLNMNKLLPQVLYGSGNLSSRTRIQCTVKSTFSETKLVPALNDLLLANPSPAAVSRFRMGWLEPVKEVPLNSQKSQGEHLSELRAQLPSSSYGTITRFGGQPFDVTRSLNVWSSGVWFCTGTGSTAAMHAAGGVPMDLETKELQYLIREHMIEHDAEKELKNMNNQIIKDKEQLHMRWNSKRGRIFIDGSHLIQNLELGDEILINNQAPPLLIFQRHLEPPAQNEEHDDDDDEGISINHTNQQKQESPNVFDKITY